MTYLVGTKKKQSKQLLRKAGLKSSSWKDLLPKQQIKLSQKAAAQPKILIEAHQIKRGQPSSKEKSQASQIDHIRSKDNHLDLRNEVLLLKKIEDAEPSIKVSVQYSSLFLSLLDQDLNFRHILFSEYLNILVTAYKKLTKTVSIHIMCFFICKPNE